MTNVKPRKNKMKKGELAEKINSTLAFSLNL